jgi:hypothetical protein
VGRQRWRPVGRFQTTSRRTPVQAIGLSVVVVASGGGLSNLGLRSDGTIWTWGTLGSGWNKQPGDPPAAALTRWPASPQ